MPRAKTGDSSDEEDSEDSENSSSSEDENVEKVNVKGKQNRSKMIKKKDKFNDRKSDKGGKMKDRKWVMKKKDR